MKYKKYLMGFLFVFSILFTTIVGTSNVLADTTSYSGAYNYDNTGNKQYRFITIVKSTQWTGNHYVSGQPTKGTYLKMEICYTIVSQVDLIIRCRWGLDIKLVLFH